MDPLIKESADYAAFRDFSTSSTLVAPANYGTRYLSGFFVFPAVYAGLRVFTL